MRLLNNVVKCVVLSIIFSCIECTKNEILYLTPYIENEEVGIGRKLSEVNSTLMLGVKSYAGFITVDKTFESNLWFWYFPVEGGEVEDFPLMIWLQGGPGSSSLVSLFGGVGPFFYVNDSLKKNPYSWHHSHSILFIDNPVGAGFSYTISNEGYSKNQTQISFLLYEFLMQFMLLFPELQPLPLYLSGQSYAGKHIPSLTHYIHNKNPTAKTFLNLKGMAIGNGWIDPPNMFNYGEFLYQLGLGDYNFKLKLEDLQTKLEETINRGDMAVANNMNLIVLLTIINTTKVSIYNYYRNNDDSCFNNAYEKFITKKKIRAALHVGGSRFFWNNVDTRTHLVADEMNSIIPIFEEMLEHYKVLVYNGQLDLIVPYPMLEDVYRNMKWSGAEKYRDAERVPLFDGNSVYGYKKKANNFEELMIRNVGHCAVAENPKLLQRVITEFTYDGRRNNGTDWTDEADSPSINELR